MARICTSVDELVGHTPLLHLARIGAAEGLGARLLAKVEGMNPAGSAKDRVARSMLDDFERRGLIGPGSTVIEPTSGNTGIGLAALGAARGLRVVIAMPDTASAERRLLMEAYGAEVVLTDGARGMAGAIERAEELAREIPGSVVAGQFSNPANPAVHYATTGPEVWEDADGAVDALVAGVGTGGTITGAGRYLREKNPELLVVAVEPADSPLLSEGRAGAHRIEGIGAGFVPQTLDRSLLDEVVPVQLEDARSMARRIGRLEGLLVGVSSGAAAWVAVQVAKRPEMRGKTVVAILPDTGERYLSTGLFG